MARSRLPDPARVPIGLRVSEADAARIDQVLARPEFAGWSRSEWCREIIQTALRYYVGEPAAAEDGQAPAAAAGQAPAAARAAEPAPTRETPVPAEEATPLLVADEAVPAVEDAEESPGRRDCSHPPDVRDYQTGTCAACGAILWD